MVRATLVRALLLSAAFACFLTPIKCLSEDGNQLPTNATREPSPPLVFDPTGKCPAFVVNPKIARLAQEKQNADEAEYAQLVKAGVSVAPIHSGLDGGMNKVFLAQFPVSILLARAWDLNCRNCHPSLGPTMTVRWRINCSAPCSN